MQGPHTLVKRSLDHIQGLLHNIAMKVKFLQVFITVPYMVVLLYGTEVIPHSTDNAVVNVSYH